jgi:predicted lysophospholipase L1 biosynthesis ABC-type transport system permease subunit
VSDADRPSRTGTETHSHAAVRCIIGPECQPKQRRRTYPQSMRSRYAWVAYGVVALCLVGLVAWPLWSDNIAWVIPFSIVAIAVMVPIAVLPGIRAVRDAMRASDN